VIAAGGIRQGQEVKAMLGIGAAPAQIGTAFIPCPESGAPEVYKQAVLAGIKAGDTVVTRAFSGRPARGLPNRLIREMDQLGQGVLDFPWQNATTRPLRNAAAKAGRAEFLALWAGEGTGVLRRLAAGELVRRILEEAR
jgi:nitronate monooxygenase